jgi:hypothetical protein
VTKLMTSSKTCVSVTTAFFIAFAFNISKH